MRWMEVNRIPRSRKTGDRDGQRNRINLACIRTGTTHCESDMAPDQPILQAELLAKAETGRQRRYGFRVFRHGSVKQIAIYGSMGVNPFTGKA